MIDSNRIIGGSQHTVTDNHGTCTRHTINDNALAHTVIDRDIGKGCVGSSDFDTIQVDTLTSFGSHIIRVGAAVATGTDGNGGTLTTTNTAISVTGVNNAVFNDVTANVTSAAGNDAVIVDHTSTNAASVTFDNLTLTTLGATGDGVVVNDNGTGELDATLRNSTVNTTASGSIGFLLNTGANTGEVDVRIQGNTITAADNNALLANINQGSDDIQFLISGGNSLSNDSAGNATAEFLVAADRTLNATIGDQTGVAPFDENSFTNANAGGTAVDIESNSAAARIDLDLRGNTATGGGFDFLLTETLGDFGVVDRANTITTETNNLGTVDLGGGGVEADFDDLASPIKQVD